MADRSAPGCDVSVVVPAYNEAESLPELVRRVHEVLAATGRDFEIIIVDDGSTDGTVPVLEELRPEHPRLRAISFSRNFGKAAALSAGFHEARGAVIITMDADLQDDPDELPALLARLDEGYDLVSGWKQDRKDSLVKNQTSKIFNAVTGLVCGLRLHDFNCGLKAYRAECAHSLRVYGEMHRYLPALAHMQGFKVTEMPVRHHARRFGTTKYGMDRFLNGFLDLLTVKFLHSRSTSPLHLFGRMGAAAFLVGAAIDGYFLVRWAFGEGLRMRPLLLLGLVLILLAVQFISLGLVAELIVTGHSPETEYRVRRRL